MAALCDTLLVSRAGFYAWRRETECAALVEIASCCRWSAMSSGIIGAVTALAALLWNSTPEVSLAASIVWQNS